MITDNSVNISFFDPNLNNNSNPKDDNPLWLNIYYSIDELVSYWFPIATFINVSGFAGSYYTFDWDTTKCFDTYSCKLKVEIFDGENKGFWVSNFFGIRNNLFIENKEIKTNSVALGSFGAIIMVFILILSFRRLSRCNLIF